MSDNTKVQKSGVSRRDFVRGLGIAGIGGLAVGVGGGYLLGGSGSSSGGGGQGGGSLKIGMVAPVTGPYSGDGQEMVRGATLAIEEINSRGGVLGRSLEMVTADVTDLSPENYVKAAQRLTGQENVAAVFGGYCSNDSAEFQTYADAGTPMFHTNTLQANVDYVVERNIPNIFEGCPTEIWYGKGFVPLMQSWIDSGAWKPSSKSVAVVTSNDPYSISIANALSEDIKKIGWTVPIFEQVTAPTADWGPVLSKIRNNPPGLIFVTDYIAGDLASFAKQFATAPTPSLLFQQYGPSIPEYMELAGDAANGVIWSTVIGILPDQIGQEFMERYRQKFNAEAGLSQAGAQYDLVRMWADVVGRVNDPYDFDAVIGQLEKTIFRGVCGTYRFDPTQNVTICYPSEVGDPSLGMPLLTYQIQDKKQVLISPEPYTGGEFQLPPWLA